jgi:RHS repeat-associated protein
MQHRHDASGDVTNDGVNAYLYDGEGRICAVSHYVALIGTTTMTGYLYDADGTRVAKGSIQNMTSCDPTLNGFQTTSDFVLGPGGEQVTEMGVDPNLGVMAWQHTNVWAGGKLLATYDGATTTEVVNGVATVVSNLGLHFHFDDPLGTRRVQTDYQGVVEKNCASLPFGDGESCAATPTEHLFTGKERDSESGNDYFGARYYSSVVGRFLSPDWSAKIMPVPYAKLDDPQSLNLYAYLMNNPLTRFDANGHACSSLSSPCTSQEHEALEAQAAESPYRLAVTSDGVEGGRRRTTYEVRKFDKEGNLVKLTDKDPKFHVTEHQTTHFGDTTSFGAKDSRLLIYDEGPRPAQMEIIRWKFSLCSSSIISLGRGYFVSSKIMPPQLSLLPR